MSFFSVFDVRIYPNESLCTAPEWFGLLTSLLGRNQGGVGEVKGVLCLIIEFEWHWGVLGSLSGADCRQEYLDGMRMVVDHR